MKLSKKMSFVILVLPIFLFAQQWNNDYLMTTYPTEARTSDNYTRCIAASSNGMLHSVWYQLANNDRSWGIFYARSTDYGETWRLQTCLYIGDFQAHDPAITVCGQDIHIVWVASDEVVNPGRIVYALSRDGGETWCFEDITTYNSCNYPSISVNNTGAVNIIWIEYWTHIKGTYRLSPNNMWSPIQTIFTPPGRLLTPASISAEGLTRNVHIATITRDWNTWELVYINSADQSNTWTVHQPIHLAGSEYLLECPSISAFNDNIQIVWMENRGNEYHIVNISSHDGGINWCEPYILKFDNVYLCDPSIIIDQANIVHVVWSQALSGTYNSEIFYQRSLDGGLTWQSDMRLTCADDLSYRPSISCNTDVTNWTSENGIYVLWRDNRPGTDPSHIYFKRGWQIGADATSPNQGRHFVRVTNRCDLTSTFQGDKAVFRQSLEGNCAPPTPMIVGIPTALENGKTPSNAVNAGNASWICYTDDQSQQLNCLIQRNAQSLTDYKKFTIFTTASQEDSVFASSLLLATPILGTPQNMCYAVYATKEDGITKIRFSAFDTLREIPYYTTVLDVGNEEITVSSPSIAVTPKDIIHVVWQRNDPGHNTSSIYYMTTLDGVTPDAIRQGQFPEWSTEYPISTTDPRTEPASNPFIEAQGERIFVVWRGPNDDGNPDFGDVWQREGRIRPGNIPDWQIPRNVSQSPDAESNYPSMSTSIAVVWQESLPEYHQIYGEIQGEIHNLSNNEYNCKYPHTNVVPTEPWYYYMWRLLTVWTQEKMSGIYQIEYGRYDFDCRWDNEIPPIAIECGEVDPSSYCVDRVGYLNFSDYSVDYGTELKYNIPYLNPEKYYLLEAICFNDTLTREKFVFEDSATKTIYLYPENPETLRIILRPEHYDNTELFLKIRKIVGENAVVAKIRLYEFELFDENGSGPQSLFAYDNFDLPTARLIHNVFPNPIQNQTTIHYQLPHTSRVNLSIYDVQGRIIKTITSETHEPGTYEALWDAKDNQGRKVANGIYFYRIETDDETAVNKIVLVR